MFFPLIALAAAVVWLSRDTLEKVVSEHQQEAQIPTRQENSLSGDVYRRELPVSNHLLIGRSNHPLHISIFGQYHPDSLNPQRDSTDPYLALTASFIVQDLLRGVYLSCDIQNNREDIFVEGRTSDLLPEDVQNLNETSRARTLFPNLSLGLSNSSANFFRSNSLRSTWLAEYGPASLYSLWGNTVGNRSIYLHASDDARHAQALQHLFERNANTATDAGAEEIARAIAQRQARLGENIARFLCSHPQQHQVRVIYGVMDFQMHLVHNMILGMNQYWDRYPTRNCPIQSLPSSAIVQSVCWVMPPENPNAENFQNLCP